jgi:hypothetical protein
VGPSRASLYEQTLTLETLPTFLIETSTPPRCGSFGAQRKSKIMFRCKLGFSKALKLCDDSESLILDSTRFVSPDSPAEATISPFLAHFPHS